MTLQACIARALDDARGSAPVLTASQRENVAKVVRRRREIRREIRALEIEYSGLPTNAALVETYGVSVGTLYNCVHHDYLRTHPLDVEQTTAKGD